MCVSLAEHGLLWVSDEAPDHLAAPAVAAFNSIGCGDTLVGATAATYERVGDVATALRAGVAAATANLGHDAPGHCEPHEVDALAPLVTDELIDEQGIERLLARPSRHLP